MNPDLVFYMVNKQSETLGLPPHERHTVSYRDYGCDYPGGGDIYRCIFTNDDIWKPFPCPAREFPAHLVPDDDQIPEQLLQEIFNPYLFFYEEQQQRQGYSGAAVPTLVSDFVQPMKPPKPRENAGEEEDEDMPGLVSASSSSSDEDEDERMESQEFQTPRDVSSA